MGYYLRAAIGHPELFVANPPQALRACNLTPTLALVPLTNELFDELNAGHTGESPYSDFEYLSSPVADWLRRLSVGGPIAYVEADYFGGVGEQAAVVFEGGGVALGPVKAPIGPINEALRKLGVVADEGLDEFATVRLGRARRLNDWIKIEPSP